MAELNSMVRVGFVSDIRKSNGTARVCFDGVSGAQEFSNFSGVYVVDFCEFHCVFPFRPCRIWYRLQLYSTIKLLTCQ